MKSTNNINKIISKLAKKYPNGAYPYRHNICATLKDIQQICQHFDIKRNVQDRHRFATFINQNTDARALFAKRTNWLIDNWIKTLIASEKLQLQCITNKKREKARRNRLKEQQKKLNAAAVKQQQETERKAKTKADLFKQLNLTAAQKKILRQLAL